MIWQVSITALHRSWAVIFWVFTWRGVSVAFGLRQRTNETCDAVSWPASSASWVPNFETTPTKRAPRFRLMSACSAAVGARRTETNSRLELRSSTSRSSGNGSLFFGRNPAMSYTTSPA